MPDYFFARQPVFDGAKSVFGYELLFRNSFQNAYTASNGEQATLDVLSNALFHSSLERMVGGKPGMVNFPREVLLSDVVLLFSPKQIIVEVLEDVAPDDEVVAGCRKLKKLGYRIALDDFIAGDLNNPLIPLADFVKVDFLKTKRAGRKLIADRLSASNVMLLAEKVETGGDCVEGLELGYRLFQGYFFSKPEIKSGRRLKPGQIACVRMLQAVFKDQGDYAELNEIISSDLSLSYRMLKLANSPYFGFRKEITSILHAITLMGCNGMKKFVALVVIGTTGRNKPTELAITCLARASMAEQIAPRIGFADEAAEYFLTGLFSLLDTLLDCEMKDALEELPIAHEVKSALLGEPNVLRNALDAIIAYERADWERFNIAASALKLREDDFPAIYASAIEWATEIFQSM
jgi:c-di-GMP-related signal transduction protein